MRFLACGLFVFAACAANAQTNAPAGTDPLAMEPVRLHTRHLPNTIRIHPNILSGGLPDGVAAFEELRSLGVRTIISVDRMKPDLKSAKAFGMRYVHLPHGYDGIPKERVIELAKAVRELQGPIYIHCHHGKHRSPAAASVACIAAGLISKSMAVSILEFAGTDPGYRGLYQSAQNAQPLDRTWLDSLDVTFPESTKVPALAEAMVELAKTHDRLKRIADADWQIDLSRQNAAHADAVLLREHFAELLRMESIATKSVDFHHLMRESQSAAEQLEKAIPAGSTAPQRVNENLPGHRQKAWARITSRCQTCHQLYRDVPRSFD